MPQLRLGVQPNYIYILLNYPELEEESNEIIKNSELNTKQNLQDPASICVLEKKKGKNNQ